MPFSALNSTQTIQLTKLRELQLEMPMQVGRPSHLSAASGLVRIDHTLYVIADDELHLAIFSLDDPRPGRVLRLGTRALDLDPDLRKRAKPDFEALVHLPRIDGYANGGLLALGSGSTAQRVAATWIELDPSAKPTGHLLTFELTGLYCAVAREVGEVNIEGAVLCDEQLFLLQRGNKGAGINALIGFDLRIVLDAMHGCDAPHEIEPLFVERFQLGKLDDVPLGFSDAAVLENGEIVFAAIAENTADSYADGQFVGAVIGLIDRNRRISHLSHVNGRAKIEGIAAQMHDSTVELLLVTDDDDPSVPASLYAAQLDIGRY